MSPNTWLMPLLISSILAGCAVTPPPASPVKKSVQQPQSGTSPLQQAYQHWQGTPYRYGGDDESGIDCSALVQQVFLQAYQVHLPRTTYHQLKTGKAIAHNEKKKGDLIFFKTADKVYHVGIYLGEHEFMHASSSKGVMISRLDNPYWAARILQIRRVKN